MDLIRAFVTAAAALMPMGSLCAAPLPLINITPTQNGYAVQGIVLGQDDTAHLFKGRISVSRKGTSGSMRVVQGGEAQVAQGARAIIATSNFSATPQDHIVILFEILLEDRVVAISTIELNDPSKK